MIRRLGLPALFALAVLVYFVNLGNGAIWDANEAFYVETPREMMEAHDYVNPSFNYEPRFNKPVLSYWIVAAFYRAFGVSVGVQRIPIALGAMLIIASAFFLARAAADAGPATRDGPGAEDRAPGRRDSAALWAAAGLAAAPRLVMFARRIFIDIWIAAFMAWTLTFFALSERYPARRRLFLVLMYVSMALGVLTKGPVAVALPGLAFALYLIARGELRRGADMLIPGGIVIVLAIVVPWYALLYREHGWTHIVSFFIGENVGRFTRGVGVVQRRGPLFYLPVLFTDSFPLSICLFGAAALWWRERGDAPRHRIQTLLLTWIGVIVLFFSFSASKQDLYIFPIVPAVAALAGIFIAEGDGPPFGSDRARNVDRALLRVTAAVTGGLLALAGAGVLLLFRAAGRVYALDGSTAVGLIAIAGGLAAVALVIVRRPAHALLVILAAVVALDWTFVVRVLPDFERYKPVPALADALRARLQRGDAVADYEVALPSLVYYLHRHVDLYFDKPPFIEAMLSPTRTYGVLTGGAYDSMRPALGARTCVIDRRPTFDVKLKNVLSREPLPEILLITNRCP